MAHFISTIPSLLDKNLKTTIHNDALAVLSNLMRVIWTATTRVSRSRKIIGEDLRLTVHESLQYITDW
ncbi:MAG: hypothetical protein ACJAVN_001825 [Roseivirga sp.]|jgi:hypothetical protein